MKAPSASHRNGISVCFLLVTGMPCTRVSGLKELCILGVTIDGDSSGTVDGDGRGAVDDDCRGDVDDSVDDVGDGMFRRWG